MGKEEKRGLINILGFNEGTFPFRYLGVPMVSSKISEAECKPLINKIVSRIFSWKSRYLSYAGRLVLVKAILFSIQVFWATHFFLPNKVLKEIDTKLRNFFWSGGEANLNKAKVAWEEVCKPYEEGGLGIKASKEWNKAAMARHLWTIICGDDSSIWADWIKRNRVKNRSIWNIEASCDSPWWWRKLLKLRDEMHNRISHIVGTGEDTFVWWDNWHPLGPLAKRFGNRIIYDSGMGKNAKVKELIENGEWKWPVANSHDMMEVKNTPLSKPRIGADRVVWNPCGNGSFSISSAWNEFRKKNNLVCWAHLIWHKKHIPRHAIILWLALRKRLPTRDKLQRYGLCSNITCVLCDVSDENIDHLFFQCDYSRFIWDNILNQSNLSYRGQPWEEYVEEISREWKGKSLRATLAKMSLGTVVYSIWRERNNRVFSRGVLPKERVFINVKRVIRDKAAELGNFPYSFQNSSLVDSWALPLCTLNNHDPF